MATLATGNVFELNASTRLVVKRDTLIIEQKGFGTDKVDRVVLTPKEFQDIADML